MPDAELTKKIGTDDLQRLLEIATGHTRVTAEIPAADLDLILGIERAPATGPIVAVVDPDLVDLGDLLRDELAAEIYDCPTSWADEARADWSIRFTTPSAAI